MDNVVDVHVIALRQLRCCEYTLDIIIHKYDSDLVWCIFHYERVVWLTASCWSSKPITNYFLFAIIHQFIIRLFIKTIQHSVKEPVWNSSLVTSRSNCYSLETSWSSHLSFRGYWFDVTMTTKLWKACKLLAYGWLKGQWNSH